MGNTESKAKLELSRKSKLKNHSFNLSFLSISLSDFFFNSLKTLSYSFPENRLNPGLMLRSRLVSLSLQKSMHLLRG